MFYLKRSELLKHREMVENLRSKYSWAVYNFICTNARIQILKAKEIYV